MNDIRSESVDLIGIGAPDVAGGPEDVQLRADYTEQAIGRSVKRREDKRLVLGQSRYVDDLAIKAQALTMMVLRSPHAYARIMSIDTSSAKALDGVVAVYTADMLDAVESIPCDWVPPGMTQVPLHPILASDEVRYVGQPVAIVIAEGRHVARDALELISVSYDLLVPVICQEEALAGGAPQVHASVKNNQAYAFCRANGNVNASLVNADVVLKRRYLNNRVTAASLEGRAVLSDYDPITGRLTHHSSSQLPHVHARALARCLDFPLHKLQLISPDVGGGFGAKLGFYVEDVLCAFAARKLGRPIRWAETRSENFLATTHGRDHIQYAELAADKEGKILALKVRLVADLGAYAMGMGPGVPAINGGLSLSGPYKIPQAEFTVIGVYTNRMPTGPYRGAGHPEASYVLERLMDDLANELSLDPAQIRKLNFVGPDEMPYRIPTGFGLDGGDFSANLDKALAAVEYDAFPEEQKTAAEAGRYLGLGIAFYSEMSGAAPTLGMFASGFSRAGHESARVVMHADGKVTVFTGSHSQGQGHETSFSQIAAGILQIPFDDIEVIAGDTTSIPFGTGTFNSRSMAVGGTAIHIAGKKLLDKARQIAAHKLQCRPQDLRYANGTFSVMRGGGVKQRIGETGIRLRSKLRQVAFKKMIRIDLPKIDREEGRNEICIDEVACEAHLGHDLPFRMPHGLDATIFFDPKGMPASFGTHISVVEVDVKTGEIKLLRHVAVDDCGRIINPLLAEGQVHGGVAQGLGQAMMEQVVYSNNGELLTSSYADYAMPRATDFPDFETAFTQTPTKFNPLGVRGIGESGTIGAPPAIVNAVLSALAPLGVTHVDMPMTPTRVWQAIQSATEAGEQADP